MDATKSKFAKILLTIFLVVLSTSPAFALGENNRNLLLIGMMLISPVIVMYYQQFRKEDFLLIFFLVTLIISPSIFHPESMRWSTVLYTAMFCLTFMGMTLLVQNSDFTIENYLNFIKYLLYAYAGVLLIQQFCVLMNLPIFSVSNYVTQTPWKLNSLSSEPSHTAQIVGALMYCYIIMSEKLMKTIYGFRDCITKDRWVWLSFLWIMLTSMSGTAFIFLMIVGSKFVRLRTFFIITTVALSGIVIMESLQIESYERFKKVLSVVGTLDESSIVNADHSASFRIVPMLRYIQMIDIGSLDTWFGHGVDYIQDRFSTLFTGVEKGTIAHGGLLIMLIDFGIIPFMLFIIFTLQFSIRKKEIQTYLLWFLIVLSIPINVQILWFTLTFFWINNYFLKTADEQIEETQ